MATKISEIRPVQTLAGVQPSTDKTAFATQHYTFSDKIRFDNGYPVKIGGWRGFTFSTGNLITGYARSMWSGVLDNAIKTLIGTNQKFYYLLGQALYNITPLQTTTVAIANSLATDYATLGTNPIQTFNGSNTITITDSNASKYAVNDRVTFSGAAAVGGIPIGDINITQIIRSVSAGSYTVRVATSATSDATGGGAAVVRATGRITVTASSHGQANGDRVKITLAADTGGILAAAINKEFIIRNVAAGTFDVFAATTATSSVSAAGGAATLYQKELDDGNVNFSFGQGYGMGKYGVGRYGVSKTSTQGIIYPRIWFIDKFANTAIMTAGNQSGVYAWTGTADTAPALITNAPTTINYAFVSNGIIVTFGANNIPNRIFSSDQNAPTVWTASSTNQVFEDDIEGAGRLISHVPANGVNLIFTGNRTYVFSYIGLPLVWSIQLLDNSVGIIGPMARCSVDNVAYWMSHNNFYRWKGGNAEIIPANSQTQSTLLNYVFDDINQDQAYKCFAWYNDITNEVNFHYPSSNSTECDRVVRVDIVDNVWSPDTFERTCAEYPDNSFYNPRLIGWNDTIYIHEYGVDADGSAMPWTLTSNMKFGGKNFNLLSGYVPDSTVTGNVSFRIQGYLYPQSPTASYDKTFTVGDETSAPPAAGIGARFWQYTWSGNVLGQDFRMGNWLEYLQPSSDT